MDNIDNVIESVMKKQIYEPIEFKQAILTVFEVKNKHNILSIIIKIVSTIIAFITITVGVVFAKDIYNWIYEIFNPMTTSKGIINMAENGYIQNVEMEYIESNGNSIKIENILMDDYNLDIVFNLKTKNKVESVYDIGISDLIITDENKNLIFCDYSNVDGYEKYCQENNIKYSSKNMNNNYSNEGYSIEILETQENNVKFIYKMYSSQYPKSKKMILQFKKINYKSNNESQSEIEGDWNIEIELLEKLYNRETIEYVQTTKNREISIKSIKASNAEMTIIFEMKNVVKSIDIEGKSPEEQKNILNARLDEISAIKEPFDEIKLENELGENFYISQASREGNCSKVYKSNGDVEVTAIFSIEKDKLTNTMKLIVKKQGKTNVINIIYKSL